MLDQEHIEARVGGESPSRQDHDIVLRTSDKPIGDADTCLRVLDGRAGEGLTGLQARVHLQFELADAPGTRSLGIRWWVRGVDGGSGGGGSADQCRKDDPYSGGKQYAFKPAMVKAETTRHQIAPFFSSDEVLLVDQKC